MKACLLAIAPCFGQAWGATLQADSLICDPVVPAAQLLENSRAVTQQPASEVLRRAQIALDALQSGERDTDTFDMAKREIAIFKGTVLITNCWSSGETSVPVTVLQSWPETNLAKISMKHRGAPATLYTERTAVTD